MMTRTIPTILAVSCWFSAGLAAVDSPDMPTTITDEVILRGGTTIYGEAVETGNLVWIKLPNQTVSFERERVVRINRRVRATVQQVSRPVAEQRATSVSVPARPRTELRGDAGTEVSLGILLGQNMATDDVQLDLGAAGSGSDSEPAGGMLWGLDAELLSTSGSAGWMWGGDLFIDRSSSDRVSAMRVGLELRGGWRWAVSADWRLDVVGGAGLAWSQLAHELTISTGPTSNADLSGSGFGPILRLEGRLGPAVAAGHTSWSMVGGLTWSSVDVSSDTTTSTGLDISVDESLSGIAPYLGLRVRFGS